MGWLLVTPSHHRTHHAREIGNIGVNFGGVLIVWDRLFGTFETEPDGPVYGADFNYEGSNNPLAIVFGEWWLMLRDVWRSRSLRPLVGAEDASLTS